MIWGRRPGDRPYLLGDTEERTYGNVEGHLTGSHTGNRRALEWCGPGRLAANHARRGHPRAVFARIAVALLRVIREDAPSCSTSLQLTDGISCVARFSIFKPGFDPGSGTNQSAGQSKV